MDKGKTGAFVVVVEVNEKSIVVKNQNNELTTVSVPESTIELIKEDTEYYVSYGFKWKWNDKEYFAHLEKIELLDDN
ncbi:hypothetical protein [Chengkuizengella marina]|uniref:Uncharacterized protein n=1 Tax=Chengkuizengella marina TaxID=2507566 RepID=A0A6N9Q1P4_9BACL|nr:hypothetical protein [Chengkuizengella marina]NBI28170.1 hypothetical protein [Chengkuizengella marina]